MAGPWEKYQQQQPAPQAETGKPWERYATQMKEQEAQQANQPGAGSALMRGGAQGLSIGLADEMAGGAAQKKSMWDAALDMDRLKAMQAARESGDMETVRNLQREIFAAGNQAKEQRMEEYRAADDAARQAYPKTFMGGEIAGGVLPSMVGIGAGVNAVRGGGLGAMTLAGGAGGAAEGALYGFNQGEGGFANRANSAMNSALIGGAIGSAVPGAGHLLGAGVRKGMNAIGRGVPKQVDMLAQALRREGINSIDDAAKRLDDLGPGAIPADLGSNPTQLAKGIARLPGKGQKIMRDAVEARKAGAKGRMGAVVDDVFGPRQNQFAAQQAAKSARQEAAEEGYGAVFAKNWGDAGPPFELDKIMKRISPSDLTEARIMAEADGVDFGRQIIADVSDDGAISFKRLPSLEEAEYIRRAVADRASSAFKSGRGGAGTSIAKLERELRKVLDDASPDLANVRKKYATDSAVMEARDKGRNLFTGKGDFDEMSVTLPQMSEAERAAMTEGARSNVADIMDTASWNAQDSLRRMRTDRNIDKAGLLLPDEKVQALVKALENERIQQLTNNQIVAGSDTAANQAAMDLLGANPNKNAASLLDFNVTQPLSTLRVLGQKLNDGRVSMQGEKVREALAELLSNPEKLAEAAKYGPRMEQLSATEQQVAALARALLQPSARVGGSAYAN